MVVVVVVVVVVVGVVAVAVVAVVVVAFVVVSSILHQTDGLIAGVEQDGKAVSARGQGEVASLMLIVHIDKANFVFAINDFLLDRPIDLGLELELHLTTFKLAHSQHHLEVT